MEAVVLLALLTSQHFLRPIDAVTNTSTNNGKNAVKNPLIESRDRTKHVLAQTNGTAILPCKITDLGTGIVTWVRKRDNQLLTVGRETHTMDTRFMVRPSTTDWILNIKNVRHDDAGLYECQIPTEPVQHRYVHLNITEAFSIIPGAPDLHVKQGSSLRLECQLIGATEPPIFVFWYRQGRMINYDAEPGLKVAATKSGSTLVVEKTQPSHGGNYTCQPSNAKSAYVMIHVIEEEEKPAAMHGGDRPSSSSGLTINVLLLLSALIGTRKCTTISSASWTSSAIIVSSSRSRSTTTTMSTT